MSENARKNRLFSILFLALFQESPNWDVPLPDLHERGHGGGRYGVVILWGLGYIVWNIDNKNDSLQLLEPLIPKFWIPLKCLKVICSSQRSNTADSAEEEFLSARVSAIYTPWHHDTVVPHINDSLPFPTRFFWRPHLPNDLHPIFNSLQFLIYDLPFCNINDPRRKSYGFELLINRNLWSVLSMYMPDPDMLLHSLYSSPGVNDCLSTKIHSVIVDSVHQNHVLTPYSWGCVAFPRWQPQQLEAEEGNPCLEKREVTW